MEFIVDKDESERESTFKVDDHGMKNEIPYVGNSGTGRCPPSLNKSLA